MNPYEVMGRLADQDFREGRVFVGHAFCVICASHLCEHEGSPSEDHKGDCPVPYIPSLLKNFVDMRGKIDELEDEVRMLRRTLGTYERMYGIVDER